MQHTEKDNMINVNFFSCVINDNKLWFISTSGMIMNMDTRNYQVDIIVPQNINEFCIERVIDQMIFFKGNLYFAEADGSYLYEYNIQNNLCKFYMIPPTEIIEGGCFSGIYLHESKVYLFTRSSAKIHVFNTDTKLFESLDNPRKCFVKASIQRTENIFFMGNNEVLSYNLKSNLWEELFHYEKEKIFAIDSYGGKIYLLTTEGKVITWSIKDKKEEIICDTMQQSKALGRIANTKTKLFLLPSLGHTVLFIDKGDGRLYSEKTPTDLHYKEVGWTKYYGCCEDEKYIWYSNPVGNYMLYIDKELENIKWLKMQCLQTNKAKIYYKNKVEKNGIFYEIEMSLRNFIESC